MGRTLLIAAASGAAAFLAADAIEMAARIGGERPWFIAALPSALMTAAFVAAAGALVSYWRRAAQFVDAYFLALVLAAGAAVPMTVTLFAHPQGPGSLSRSRSASACSSSASPASSGRRSAGS